MSDGVEWGLHCCLVLATLPEGQALPAARLAELNDVPPAYLAKHLQALSAAGITRSSAGPAGGYRLARPPSEVSALDVVLAIEGDETAFRCGEIRQRGPLAGGPELYRRPCGIARAMWRAEDAWRAELAATSVGDLLAEFVGAVPTEHLVASAAWIQGVQRTRRGRQR
jgi:Rrf2 family protein